MKAHYNRSQMLLHWLSAVVIIAMFILGVWMHELDYYSPWYQIAPEWHQSIGILLMFTTMVRVFVKWFSSPITPLKNSSQKELFLAKLVHNILYLGLFGLFVSGYLITTAKGESLKVFDWFEISAWLELDKQADIAGEVHEIMAYALILLVILHALAALKHHFKDKGDSLKRMSRWRR